MIYRELWLRVSGAAVAFVARRRSKGTSNNCIPRTPAEICSAVLGSGRLSEDNTAN
jgi:hypothetical protein